MTYAAHCYASRTCEHPTSRELFGSAAHISDRGDKLPSIIPAMTQAPRPIRRMPQHSGERANGRGETGEEGKEADGKILGT